MLYIAYHTAGTAYSEMVFNYIMPSLIKFKLPFYIAPIQDRGNWLLNTSYKPKFILDMLNEHKKDVVYLDVDSRVIAFPYLFYSIPPEYDMAAHWLDWELQWRGKPGDRLELLTGTLMFRYSPKVIDLLKTWDTECENNPEQWEQKTLQEVLDGDSSICSYRLPPEYCTVVLHDESIPPHIKDPVIVHYQASRKHRR